MIVKTSKLPDQHALGYRDTGHGLVDTCHEKVSGVDDSEEKDMLEELDLSDYFYADMFAN